jgi:hypothetical protein
MRSFDNEVLIHEMIGEWYLVATTQGHFDLRPKVLSARLWFERQPKAIRFRVEYTTPRKTWRFHGKVPDKAPRSGVYNWTGSGGWFVASRLAWGLARSADGVVVAAHNPGTMITNEGLLFLARAGTPHEEAVETVKREYLALGLDGRELDALSWRVGKPETSLHSPPDMLTLGQRLF